MAEGVGFEPTRSLRPWRFSRPLPSAAWLPFRGGWTGSKPHVRSGVTPASGVCGGFARVRQLCRVCDSFMRMRQVCAGTTALSYRASPGAVQQRPVGRRSGASRRGAFAVRVREKLDGTDMAGAGGQYEAARGRCETDGQTFGPREAFGSGQTHRSSIGPRLTRKRAEAALRMARGLARGRIGNRPGGWPGNGSRMARARQGPPGLAKARPEPTRARPEPTRARPEPTRAARSQPGLARSRPGSPGASPGPA